MVKITNMCNMDYIGEQNAEFEAIESIYYGDLTSNEYNLLLYFKAYNTYIKYEYNERIRIYIYINTSIMNHVDNIVRFIVLYEEPFKKFSIFIKSDECNTAADNCIGALSCKLVFTYTEKYPEEPLEFDIEVCDYFNDEEKHDLETCLTDEVNNNLGGVIVFSVVSAAQEWLNVKCEEKQKELEMIQLQKQKEEYEEENKRFDGTPVTVETFLRWQLAFEEEMALKEEKVPSKEGKRLTGRELFMTDESLNQSDLQFLDEGNVQVDESLFQDFNDLELEDDEC